MKTTFAVASHTLSSLILLVFAGYAIADTDNRTLPGHETICIGSNVSKKMLARHLLADNPPAQALVLGDPTWYTIFTDDNFCQKSPEIEAICKKDPKGKACVAALSACDTAQRSAMNYALTFFKALDRRMRNDPAPPYKVTGALVNAGTVAKQIKLYFDGNDGSNPVICTAQDVKALPKGDVADGSPVTRVRVRGNSDDLYLDRGQKEFDAASKASGTFTGDTSAAHSYTTKIQGSVGFEFDAGDNGQIIPYVSLSQSLSDTKLKPRVIDPTNFVSVGVLATNFFDSPGTNDIKHAFSVKPQYLFNTANQAEIVGGRLIYAPWTYFADLPINFNSYQYINIIPGDTLATLLFDVRSDFGIYTNRGNTPAIVAVNTDFGRIGTRFGFSMTTANPDFPSLTLTIAETYPTVSLVIIALWICWELILHGMSIRKNTSV
jgi:hypothetical protein